MQLGKMAVIRRQLIVKIINLPVKQLMKINKINTHKQPGGITVRRLHNARATYVASYITGIRWGRAGALVTGMEWRGRRRRR